jgi:hypothetical protein
MPEFEKLSKFIVGFTSLYPPFDNHEAGSTPVNKHTLWIQILIGTSDPSLNQENHQKILERAALSMGNITQFLLHPNYHFDWKNCRFDGFN